MFLLCVPQVGNAMRIVGGSSFVKLSTRSPKDLIYGGRCAEVDAALKTELAKESARLFDQRNEDSSWSPEFAEEVCANAAAAAWLSACALAFECKDVTRVEALLMRSTRVLFDLNSAVEDWEDNMPILITVRAWEPMAPCAEFRGFVVGGKLKAIPQHHHHCVFHEIAAHRERIQRDIQDFFLETEPILRAALGGARYLCG
jgi:hypothetical protein